MDGEKSHRRFKLGTSRSVVRRNTTRATHHGPTNTNHHREPNPINIFSVEYKANLSLSQRTSNVSFTATVIG